MKRLLVALALLLTGTLARAELKIEGETAVKAHRLVRLKATGHASGSAIIWRYDKKKLDAIKGKDTLDFTGEPGTYIIEALAIRLDKDGNTVAEEAEREITIGGAAPKPPTPPDPTPVPASGKLWVLIVEETADAASTRGRLFGDKGLAARIKEKGHRWRVTDKDAVTRDGTTPKDLAPWIARAKTAGLPRLFLVDAEGGILWEGAVPKTAEAMLDAIKKAGG